MTIGRSGEPWTEAEEAHLARLFRAGLPLAAIAAHIERSPAAVTTRLVRLGLLIYVPARGAWFDVSVPWAVRTAPAAPESLSDRDGGR